VAALRSVVVGVDGSAPSRRAAAFLARLEPPRGGRATIVSVVEPLHAPSTALLPGRMRGRIAAMSADLQRERLAAARRRAASAARRAAAGGWKTEAAVRVGVPVDELLRAVSERKADLLVLGARGTSGLDRLLLGSVSQGALRRAAVPVVIVK